MSSNDLLYNSLKGFYSKKKHRDEMLSIIENNTALSLRLIDWFITNYSKKNNIEYYIFKDNENNFTLNELDIFIKRFNVYHSYKSQLKAYSKRRFDPFCRRERISFKYIDKYDDIKCIDTTIGQLNFFKWAINNRVLEYILDKKDMIENDMNISLKNNKKDINCKRKELSKSITRGLNKNIQGTTIDFN